MKKCEIKFINYKHFLKPSILGNTLESFLKNKHDVDKSGEKHEKLNKKIK